MSIVPPSNASGGSEEGCFAIQASGMALNFEAEQVAPVCDASSSNRGTIDSKVPHSMLAHGVELESELERVLGDVGLFGRDCCHWSFGDRSQAEHPTDHSS